MEISIRLPFFPGFYETHYNNSDTAYRAIKEELEYYFKGDLLEEHPEYRYLTEDDLDFDDAQYEKDIMEGFIEVWKNHAPDFITDIRFDTLDRPRYYNFRNDRLYAYITLADNWEEEMRHFIALNHDWLSEKVHEDWTSYDGFISFMENEIDEWDTNLFNEQDPRYIGTMIGYMMLRENKNIYDDLLMETMEDIYDGSYVFITPEAEERLKEMIENGEITIPDPAQLELPLAFE